MSLKTKFLILLSAIFTGLLLVNFSALSLVIYPTFEKLEIREAEKNIGRVVDILESDIQDIDSMVYDWAAWDDTYNYIKDRNQAYVDGNYTLEYAVTANQDLYYIWDPKGKPILNKALNEEGTAFVSFDSFPAEGLPENHPFLALNTLTSKWSGLIQTRRGPMIIAARPIMKSSLQGPIRGILAMGRYLDEELIGNIIKRSHLNLEVWSLKGKRLENIPKDAPKNIKPGSKKIVNSENGNNVFVYSSYPDIYGDPVALLKVSMPRDIVIQGKSAIIFGQWVVLFSGIVIVAILFYLLQKSIVSPLSSIARDIVRFGKHEKFSHQLPLERKDELGIVARAVLEGSEERNKTEKFLVLHNRELEETQNKLIESKIMAENSSRAKSEFLARMSHELRTPMNAILGFAQLLEMDAHSKMSDVEKKNVGMISSAGKHLLELINEVLDLSQVESGDIGLSIDTVDMAPIVDNVISFSKSLAKEKGVSLEYHKIPEDCCFVEVDPLRFKQVVLNLVSNAIKYNKPNGSVIVSFEIKDNSLRRLGVRDTGHGIPDDKKDKLFKPFERFDMDAEHIEGAGIGITISKQLIELMYGTIDFESKEGEGSYFYIDVPVSVKAPLPIQIEEKVDSIQRSITNNNKKKVLYIEDIPANVELVRQIFRHREEINLLSAATALAGIELAQSETPDLILMDSHMPGMDGLTAFKELQTIKKTQNIPVIALTADAMDGDINKTLDMGFKGYLTKPIEVSKFLNAIDEVLA
jgi:signal transduction histidine kinase/ActR/RegA family two-component response regulator